MRNLKALSTVPVLMTVFAAGGMSALSGNCNLSGLPSSNGNDNGCGDGNPAILLTITTEEGATVPRSRITVRHDLGTPSVGGCTEDFPCADFPIGINLFGRFDLEVAPPGYEIATRIVNVGSSDNCNPTTEDVVIVVTPDATVAALSGAWRTTNVFGTTDVRFGDDGEVIGAVQYDRQAGGDGNFYISYNNRAIRGAFGQDIFYTNADEPVRSGAEFTWSTTTLGMPTGFEGAVLSSDFLTLQGTLAGTTVQYERLEEVPSALQDP